MKQILITTILALFLSVGSNAQDKKPTRINYYSPELLDEIKATTEQRQKIADLFTEWTTRSQEVKNDNSLSDEEKKAKLKQISNTRSKAYNKLLTPEQSATLAKMREEIKAKNANQ